MESTKANVTERKVVGTVSLEITQKFIDDLVTTAFEGGINYWCGEALRAGTFTTSTDLDDHQWYTDLEGKWQYALRDAESRKIFHSGHQVPFYRDLDNAAILEGLQMYCNSLIENGEDILLGQSLDADVADVIVQYAVFKEIIFG